MIVSWVVRFILFLLAFFLIRKLVSVVLPNKSIRGADNPRRSFSGAGRREIQGETVKDPHCGIYVAKSIAIQENAPAGTLYFCSETCRREYLKKSGR